MCLLGNVGWINCTTRRCARLNSCMLWLQHGIVWAWPELAAWPGIQIELRGTSPKIFALKRHTCPDTLIHATPVLCITHHVACMHTSGSSCLYAHVSGYMFFCAADITHSSVFCNTNLHIPFSIFKFSAYGFRGYLSTACIVSKACNLNWLG
jgi:hypothetical protein